LIRAVASESEEFLFGTTKDHGMENVVVHHVLADLRITVEQNFRRKAIVKSWRSGRAELMTPRPSGIL